MVAPCFDSVSVAKYKVPAPHHRVATSNFCCCQKSFHSTLINYSPTLFLGWYFNGGSNCWTYIVFYVCVSVFECIMCCVLCLSLNHDLRSLFAFLPHTITSTVSFVPIAYIRFLSPSLSLAVRFFLLPSLLVDYLQLFVYGTFPTHQCRWQQQQLEALLALHTRAMPPFM